MKKTGKHNRTVIVFSIITSCLFSVETFGQGFTLKQCVDYATKNCGNIINANYDVSIAEKKVNEQIGSMLPQIDASGSYTDNLKLSTTLLPGEMLGQPGTKVPVTMGTKQNVSGNIQLSQKVFDPTFGIALDAAKLNKTQAELSFKQTSEKIQYTISSLYYQTLVIGKQMNSLQTTLISSKKLLESTELKFKNGMAKKVDVDKIRVSFNNTQSQLHQSELNYSQSLNNLKYYMGMPVENTIVLTDTAMSLSSEMLLFVSDSISIDNRTDYQLQKVSLNAYELEKKRNQASYLPSLSFNANYSINAMRNEFDFFNSGDWYRSSYIGLSLKMPIFDGFQRSSRVNQSKLNIEKSKVSLNQVQQSIKVDLTNSEIQYKNAIDNIQNEKANLDLAEAVFKNTQLQYQQGTNSSLDLVQAESSFRESLNNYYNKLLSLYIARISLEQSKGTLTNYINNLK